MPHREPNATPSTTSVPRGAIESAPRVRSMFGRIVRRYDLMNHVMTFGMDIRWRGMVSRRAAAIDGRTSAEVLDVATGTGDLALATRKAGATHVTGIDFSPEMIAAAKEKGARRHADVVFTIGDAMALPYTGGAFDACTVAFGLRNMPDYAAAVREMSRILRPGGRFLCLEMTPLRRPVAGALFRLYFERIVPFVGGIVSGDRDAYRYLPKSVAAFPTADQLAGIMKDAGLTHVSYELLGFGTVALHAGTKSADAPVTVGSR